jgi:hypothetical protein
MSLNSPQEDVLRRSPHRWQKGISGNPSGKPRLGPGVAKVRADVRAAAKEWTTKAISTLGGALTTKGVPWSVKVQAANALLDRGWGRPTESLDVSLSGPSLDDIILAAMKLEKGNGDGAKVIEGEPLRPPSETPVVRDDPGSREAER